MLDKDELEKYVTCPFPAKNFREFMRPWLGSSGYLFNVAKEPEDFSRLIYEVVEDAYQDNVKYLELRACLFYTTWGRTSSFKDILKNVTEAIGRAEKDFGMRFVLGFWCWWIGVFGLKYHLSTYVLSSSILIRRLARARHSKVLTGSELSRKR